jgi:predicted metal-binding membrane protein
MADAVLAAVLRRDRTFVLTCLIVLVLIAWSYVLWLSADMDMGGMDMPEFRMIPARMGLMMPVTAPWQAIEFAFVFAMWAVMMVGMMTPSAAPLVLLYARVGRQVAPGQAPFAASSWFAGGYLVAWIAFSLIATIAQWAIERAGWLGPYHGERQEYLRRVYSNSRRIVPMVPVQGRLPAAMPSPITVHSASRRV